MFTHPFWQYSGVVFWGLIILYILLRVTLGKDWFSKAGMTLYFGRGLIDASRKMIKEVRQGKIQDETVSDVVVYVFWRITRIGAFAMLIAAIPLMLLWRQNELIDNQNALFQEQNNRIDSQLVMFQYQNERINQQTDFLKEQTALFRNQNQFIDEQTGLLRRQDQKLGFQNELFLKQNLMLDTQNYRLNLQNNLIEADRRSSLVFLMSNVLDKVDEEIKQQKQELGITTVDAPDSVKFALSKPLVNRIVGLSRAFRPYRMMQGDTLSGELVSPERGQLFIALMESHLDDLTQNTIVRSGNFDNAVIGRVQLDSANLSGANLIGANLSGANLSHADLSYASLFDANLSGANLNGADLRYAGFIGADLRSAGFIGADLSDAYSRYADFRYARLSGADLSYADLFGADLRYADLRGADLRGASLVGADLGSALLSGADLRYADLGKIINITANQLKEAISLFGCKNLDPEIEQTLRAERPCLFTEEGCQ